METSRSLSISPPVGKAPPARDLAQALRTWFGSRQGLIVTGVVLAIPAVALGWTWLGAATMIQLLFVLPCAGMMLMCMKGMGAGQKDAATKQEPQSGKTDG